MNEVQDTFLLYGEAYRKKHDLGQPVEVAIKLENGIDEKNLAFYRFYYDEVTKNWVYKQIPDAAYRLDTNGYVHFITEFAGDIVIGEGALAPKGQN